MSYAPTDRKFEAHGKTVGTGDWEQVVAPIDCSYYQIIGSFWKCSDKDDANTCRNFSDGFAVLAPFSHEQRFVRWSVGDHITWVKSNTPLDLYFLR